VVTNSELSGEPLASIGKEIYWKLDNNWGLIYPYHAVKSKGHPKTRHDSTEKQ
jgi:hypothetical protein